MCWFRLDLSCDLFGSTIFLTLIARGKVNNINNQSTVLPQYRLTFANNINRQLRVTLNNEMHSFLKFGLIDTFNFFFIYCLRNSDKIKVKINK